MVDPHRLDSMPSAQTALSARLPVGEVHSQDLVFVRAGVVSRVMRFWKADGEDALIAQVKCFLRVDDEALWRETERDVSFVDSDEIVSAVPWAYDSGSTVRIIVPILFRSSV